MASQTPRPSLTASRGVRRGEHGREFTYYYELVGPGTFMYHCHNKATEHMQMGILYMQLIQNMLPDGTNLNSFLHDQELAIQPPAPAAMHAKLVATAGAKILLRIASLATVEFTTLASSLSLQVVGRGARLLRGLAPSGGGIGKSLYGLISSVTLGCGESYDTIIDTTGVPHGAILTVPITPRLGLLRQSAARLIQGKIYFAL